MRILSLVLVTAILAGCAPVLSPTHEGFAPASVKDSEVGSALRSEAFLGSGLKTNTAMALIPLQEVLNGGPAKDGIPAIDRPKFVAVEEVKWLEEDSLGVWVEGASEAKFYPYDVLYWHEIVNDTMDGVGVAVTFCPLCGSAITYVRGEDSFGVSGKLWESNLLMYDRETETLWSQIEGRAVVGDRVGEKLEVYPSAVVRWGDVREQQKEIRVLSRETGYQRRYGVNPYGTYEQDGAFYFPVREVHRQFHPKTLFIAGEVGGEKFALKREDVLTQTSPLVVRVSKEPITVTVEDGVIRIERENGDTVPYYTAMWFSWANHNSPELAAVWSQE